VFCYWIMWLCCTERIDWLKEWIDWCWVSWFNIIALIINYHLLFARPNWLLIVEFCYWILWFCYTERIDWLKEWIDWCWVSWFNIILLIINYHLLFNSAKLTSFTCVF